MPVFNQSQYDEIKRLTKNAGSSVAENGLPIGGTNGQILEKSGGVNFSAEWVNKPVSGITYVQATDPALSSPYVWYQTEGGALKTVWVNVI